MCNVQKPTAPIIQTAMSTGRSLSANKPTAESDALVLKLPSYNLSRNQIQNIYLILY